MHLTPHQARYYSLGEPGPAIQHIWLGLHGHGQPVRHLAAQLVNLDTPEHLLLLPQAPGAGATWFQEGSLAQDLANVRAYLGQLVAFIQAACPPGTPLTVLGCGEGATAAGTWLARNPLVIERLLFYAAVFPAGINRHSLFAGLPARPIVVLTTTPDVLTAEARGHGLAVDLQAAGHPAQLHHVGAGPLPQAAPVADSEPNGLRRP